VTTAGVGWLIKQQRFTVLQLALLVGTTSGCIIAASESVADTVESQRSELFTVAFALLSTVGMSSRNVALKNTSGEDDFYVELFVVYGAGAFVLALFFVLDFVFVEFSFESLEFEGAHVGASFGLFALYNILSWTVMARVGVFTHSVLNVSKRIFIITASVVLKEVAATPMLVVGCCITITSTLAFSQLNTAKTNERARFLSVFNILPVCLLCIVNAMRIFRNT